jgi:putative hydrolase of the HAD superfamily
MKEQIDTLIFDFGCVLSKPQDVGMANKMASMLGVGMDAFQAAYKHWRSDFDRGVLDSASYWTKISGDLGIDPTPCLFAELGRLDIESWMQIDTDMISFIERLRPIVRRLAILSNMPTDAALYVGRTFPWLSLFDTTVFSCDLKIIKPERGIFLSCLAALGSEPGKCLFVDDIGENVEGARKAGLHAHQYTGLSRLSAEIGEAWQLSL